MNETEKAWFYGVGGERRGPVTEAEIRALLLSGSIQASTLVWREGMAGWEPLLATPLSVHLDAAPPGLPPTMPAPLSASVSASAEPPADDIAAAVKSCFSKYATFSGRAARPEFWWFVVFSIFVGIVSAVFDLLIAPGADVGIVNSLASLVLFLPSVSVTVRRLHDLDRTGWWWWIWLVPVVGVIVLIVFLCQQGTPGPNRYGPPPPRKAV